MFISYVFVVIVRVSLSPFGTCVEQYGLDLVESGELSAEEFGSLVKAEERFQKVGWLNCGLRLQASKQVSRTLPINRPAPACLPSSLIIEDVVLSAQGLAVLVVGKFSRLSCRETRLSTSSWVCYAGKYFGYSLMQDSVPRNFDTMFLGPKLTHSKRLSSFVFLVTMSDSRQFRCNYAPLTLQTLGSVSLVHFARIPERKCRAK